MRRGTHRKQILLFLVAVILPSAVLVFFTSRMISQEQELAEKRERDQHHLLAREFSHDLLTELETIKLQQLDAFRAREERLCYGIPGVELVGLVKENRLLLPWEFDPRRQQSFALLNSSKFALEIQKGEREEFANNDLKEAAGTYRRALAGATHPVQQGYARLLLARVLGKLRSGEESLTHYREVLGLPFEVVDEAGIPMALYAAGPLAKKNDELREISERIEAELSTLGWLTHVCHFLTLSR